MLIAIALPPTSGMYHHIEHKHWVSGLMRGISLAVIGLQLTVAWSIISRRGSD